jgi:hypothetical protein
MSFCAQYVPNTTECSNIPPQDQFLKNFSQNLVSQQIPITKQFALGIDPSFYPVSGGCGIINSQSQNQPYTWGSCDPRLMDQVRGFKTTLSRPPYKLNVNCDLTNIDYDGSVTTYKNLADINVGDRIYYYNRDLAQPFIPENFSIPANIRKEIFIDPMTSVKPQYYRDKKVYSVGCDQTTRDQMVFREDMMERFLRKPNQRSWENFYAT